ncbi:hypothetical protein DPMN_025146 [Dreissena polymorpha]|uniref:Uncharacterized protein n=1 Tax=Dreissena polymorpha TaxID=45954 RepID=A0A9D4LQ85_DREPO|nr:hypothetical protein DPMN_044550 [Dreissena polymorpha]KAH3862180.1 hypothetical protein DPMN_025146 [Dreissena polymorpha]
MTICFFPDFYHSTTSGRRVVWTASGNISLFPKSTSMFQLVVPSRIDDLCVVCVLLVSRVFTTDIVYQPDGLGCTTQGGKTTPILLDCILNIKKQNVS